MKIKFIKSGIFILLYLVSIHNVFSQTGTKITQTSKVVVKLNSVLHINCQGDKKGAINIMVSGGIPPYSYKWSNGAVSQDIAGLAAGKYTVIVRDSYDCPDTLMVEVKEPPKLMVSVDSVQDILCYGFKNGRIDVTVQGGVAPYVYSWSNESSSQDLVNVEAGEYALLVTDAKNCQEIASAYVKQNPLIVKSNEKIQNVSCSGDSTGVIDIDVKGGVPPYKFRWTSGHTSEDMNKLTAGEYTVMVNDSRGCTEAYSTKVIEPDPIIIKLDEVRNISCAGDKSGAINVDVSGGEKPYKYRWNETFATTQDLAGLQSGDYKLVVEDSKLCKKTFTQKITEPEKLVVDILNVKDVMNYGGSDGAIFIATKGGVQPYAYNWSNGAKSKDIANLPANNYTCRILDANKCVNTISVNIKQPALLEAEIEKIEHINCNGKKTGLISVSVKGGVVPYKYLWSNGDTTKNIQNLSAGTYSLLITDANGVKKTVKATINQPDKLTSSVQLVTNISCYGASEGIIDINVSGGTTPYTYNWSNGLKTQDIAKVGAGKYTVQIIDKNRCIDSLSATIKQNPLLEVGLQEAQDIKCFGKPEGNISVSVTGGVAPYKFNWNNGSTTQNLSNLTAGAYVLKVTDAKGCEQSLDVKIKEPTLLQSSLGETIHVKCKGDSTGAVSVNVLGGTAPYSFKWSNGKTTKDISGVKAGSYLVNIVDSKGCINSVSATVQEPTKLVSSIGKITNIDCYGDQTGAVDVSVTGGVPPYNFTWNNNTTTQNLVGIKSGDYSLSIKDQNGCKSELKATVNQNTELKTSVGSVVNIACNGFKTGSATVNVSGGVLPYIYKWNNGAVTKDLTAVKADNYSLIVTDAKGCSASLSLSITEPTPFVGEITNIKRIGCHGEANGEITTNFRGGVAPYVFAWSNQQTTKDVKNLIAGAYSVTATDKNGCTVKLETIIEQPAKLELKLLSVKDNLCAGDRNGTIDISVIGGVTPYTYAWSNGATTQDLSDMPSGNYSVLVSGATGCQQKLEASIKEPSVLALSIASTKDVLCNGGNNGAIDLTVKGGKEPYIYSWSNGAVTQDIVTVVAGSYTVNVMDANGCTQSISKNILQPDVLEAVIADVKNIACFGDSTGAISIDVKGGTQPYTYAWSNGKTTEDISNLKIGDYSVVVKDANGCSQTLKATITQPTQMVAKVVSTKDVLCNGIKEGSIDISVIGGITPYVYSWNSGSKEQDLENVSAGKYEVKIVDGNGCTRNLKTEIKEPSMLVVSIAEIKEIKEFGKTNGSISISVSGGVSPYVYSWSNGAVTQNIADLVAGDYSVIVLDKNNCRQDLNASVKQPEAIVIKVDTIHHIKCYNENTGFVKITAKGGVPPYSYTWSNGFTGNIMQNVVAGKYILTVQDANGAKKEETIEIEQPDYFNVKISDSKNPTCYELNNGMIIADVKGGTTPYTFNWSNGSSSQNIKGLTSGKFKIVVTDARGCIQKDSIELTKPTALEAQVVKTVDIKCNGDHKGDISITVKGGVAPYEYNWSNGAKTQNLTGVIAGSYSVKVIDVNGCQKTLNADIKEPPVLVSRMATIKDVPCQGEKKGLLTTSVTGGTAPYKYKWSNMDSTASISNLPIGNYSVTITDANLCINTLSASISEPTKLNGSVTNVNNINCSGDKEGSVSINVTGGVVPYKFFWNNGKNDQNLTKVGAGEYSVKVTDANGCEINLSAKIVEPDPLVATVDDVTSIKCFGNKTGGINVSVKGGVQPYIYSWSNGAVTQDLLQIGAGNYNLKVTDSKGCNSTLNTTVEEPQLLEVENVSVGNIKCFGGKEGELTISVKGGVAPYAFVWNNGSTSKDLQNIPAGNYELKVTDANGCIKTTNEQVTEPPVLKFSIDAVKHISCTGESNGSVNLSVSGGTVPYSYQWSNGVTTQDLIDVPAGNYSVIIKESNGCESTTQVTITEPTKFNVALVSSNNNNCFGDKNGSIKISAEGGTLPYVFNWSNGAKTQNLENIGSGDYSVLVSDANGCNHTIKTTITQPDRLVLAVDSARNVKCCGDTSGAIFISVKGGVAPYKYLWSHGKTTQDVTGLVEGQYTVTVTDANGCTINTPEEGATIYEKIISQGKFITQDILFDIGKATIKEKSFIEISRIASFMKEHPELRFSIEGHTDNQGDDATNLLLSKNRAKSIKESLIKFGISESRLETQGWGESKPLESNNTPEGRAKNRRVEFIPL